jgi:hypothetical protein
MVGFQEEAEMDRKVGFLVNHAKMIKREQNLVAVKMLLKEQNKDADQPVPLVKHIRKGREHRELARYFETTPIDT